MDVSLGFVPEVVRQLSMPTFTLYGDGTAIYRPQGGTFDAPPPLQQAQLSVAQMEDLIGFALGAGGIAAADAVYDNMFVTDQPTTNFILDAFGVDKTVSVYALGFPPPEPSPDDAELARLTRLGETLSDFDAWVADGGATAEGAYEPTQYLATISPVSPDDTTPAAEWPVADVTLVTPSELSTEWVVLTPEQVAQVTTVPSGGVGGLSTRPRTAAGSASPSVRCCRARSSPRAESNGPLRRGGDGMARTQATTSPPRRRTGVECARRHARRRRIDPPPPPPARPRMAMRRETSRSSVTGG